MLLVFPLCTEIQHSAPSSLPHATSTSITAALEYAALLQDGETLMHVDTGANGNVTCVSNELHNVVSSNVVCQTAKIGDNDQVGYIGTLLLPCLISADRTLELEMSLPNTVELPHYRRRSLSIHALKRLGYEADHRLRRHGNLLWLKLPTNGKEYSFKLLTFDDTDYLANCEPP
jgi:hypothetical protein